MEILAIIGLIAILWLIGRTLKGAGRAMDSFADYLSDRTITPKQIRRVFEKEREANRMLSIKTDEERFNENVLEEIEDLERQINSKKE